MKNKSIGEIIKEKREELNLTLFEVENELKIKQKYLNLIEKDNFTKFSSHTHAKGFLKNYAKFLGLNYESLVAMYRRDIENASMKREIVKKELEDVIPEANKSKLKSIRNFKLSEQRIKVIAFVSSVFIILIVIFSIIRSAFSNPYLKILSPIEVQGDYEGQIEYLNNSLEIKGETEKGIAVKINEVPVKLNADYTFTSDLIPVNADSTIIVIDASNSLGKSSTIKLNITQPQEIERMDIRLKVINPTNLKILTDDVLQTDEAKLTGEEFSYIALYKFEVSVINTSDIELFINGEQYNLQKPVNIFMNDGKEIKNL
jgi:cytoskeleton protein RodZ